MSQFRILSAGTLDSGVGFQRPRQNLPAEVSLDSPAIDVMTDLTQVAAQTVTANESVDEAEETMIASGVRLLFVTNALNQVIGIVTSRDTSGERVLRYISESKVSRSDITVREIMTPQHRIEVLEMGDIATARVGDVVATLKRMGRQHALVVDRSPEGRQTIRGLLSTTQIGHQLGETIDTKDVAGNFADLARSG